MNIFLFNCNIKFILISYLIPNLRLQSVLTDGQGIFGVWRWLVFYIIPNPNMFTTNVFCQPNYHLLLHSMLIHVRIPFFLMLALTPSNGRNYPALIIIHVHVHEGSWYNSQCKIYEILVPNTILLPKLCIVYHKIRPLCFNIRPFLFLFISFWWHHNQKGLNKMPSYRIMCIIHVHFGRVNSVNPSTHRVYF